MVERGPRVLVVDDERFFREAIAETLAAAGIDAEEVASGADALARAEDPALGVVVLDVQMPGLDGLEVLRRLRADRPELRIIILSASTEQDLVLEALRLGACDYLAKPLHDEELVLAVRRALESYGVREHWRELRRRMDRLLHGLQDVARKAGEGAGGEARIAEAAVRAAAEVTRAGRASLLLADAEGRELRVAAGAGLGAPLAALAPVRAGEDVAGRVFAEGEPALVEDLRRDPRFPRDPERERRYRSASCCLVPIGEGPRRLGVLCASEREGGEPFDAQDLGLLRLLALQIAGPLAAAGPGRAPADPVEATAPLVRADPLAEPGSAERDAELARAVCEAVTAEVEPERVVRGVLAPVAQLLGADPVALFLVDGASGELVCEGQGPGLREDRASLPRGLGLTGLVFETGRLVAAPDPAADARFAAEIDTPADGAPAPLLCVPLRLRGKTVGVCRAFFEPGGKVSPRSGEVLAATLSAAVRSVLLYRSLLETIDEIAEARRAARREPRAEA
jgi:DNA-binding response OmpR family regulator